MREHRTPAVAAVTSVGTRTDPVTRRQSVHPSATDGVTVGGAAAALAGCGAAGKPEAAAEPEGVGRGVCANIGSPSREGR